MGVLTVPQMCMKSLQSVAARAARPHESRVRVHRLLSLYCYLRIPLVKCSAVQRDEVIVHCVGRKVKFAQANSTGGHSRSASRPDSRATRKPRGLRSFRALVRQRSAAMRARHCECLAIMPPPVPFPRKMKTQ